MNTFSLSSVDAPVDAPVADPVVDAPVDAPVADPVVDAPVADPELEYFRETLIQQLIDFESIDSGMRETISSIATACDGDNTLAVSEVCSALVEYFDQRLRPVYNAVVTLGERPKSFNLTKAQKEKGEQETAFHRQYRKVLAAIQHIKPIVADRLQHKIDGNVRIDFSDWINGDKKQFTASPIVAPAPAPEQVDKGDKDISPLVQNSVSPDIQAAILESLDWEYLLESAALAARREDAKVTREAFLKRAESLFANAVSREEKAA